VPVFQSVQFLTNFFQAYNICKEQDRVPEMVFLLGRMGNNKQALTLIIERLGDVNRVSSSQRCPEEYCRA
jgi:hypothetical protein